MAGEPRPLRVLGAFQPFGLSAERLRPTSKFSYALFDPQHAQTLPSSSSQDTLPTHNHDEELFIHANCVVWSAGQQVRKRFSGLSAVLQAVWCRFPSIVEPHLCILYSDSLAIFTPAGEMTIIPLPHAVASLWPIPAGLFFQLAPIENTLLSNTVSSSYANKLPNLNCNKLTQPKFSQSLSSLSHLVLQHPLEELQALQYEKDGSLHVLEDVDEQIMWTSSDISYLASYHKGTSKHSIWSLKPIQLGGGFNFHRAQVSHLHPFECSSSLSLQRVWQDERVCKIADQVFFATGDDSKPIICFLMKDSQEIFAIALSNSENFSSNNDRAWTKHAIAAVPVIATRPWLCQSGKQFDLVTLSANGSLFLHRGKNQLCQLYFPWSASHMLQSATPEMKSKHIVALSDPVQGRLNVVTSSGQVYRCAVSRQPASSLAVSCMIALEEGLESPFRNHFISSLWGNTYSWSNNFTDWEVGQGESLDAEWASFADLLAKWCNVDGAVQSRESVVPSSAWEFLLRSNMHRKNKDAYAGLSALPSGFDAICKRQADLIMDHVKHKDTLAQVLNILHAVYENYKLDSLHWRDLGPLASLLGLIASTLFEWNYLDYYARDFPHLFELFSRVLPPTSLTSLKLPFNIFDYLEGIIKNGKSVIPSDSLPSIYTNQNSTCVSFTRKVLAFYELLVFKGAVTGVLPSGIHLTIADGSFQTPEQRLVLAMVGEKFSLADLDRLPAGVSLLLRHALNSCREAPPSDWPESAFVLVGREDLALMCTEKHVQSRSTCLAAPYMLHLQPVPSTACESLPHENTSSETFSPVDKANDGMEHMFSGVIQLRFGRDLRLNEVRRLLCSSRPVAVRMANPPDVSDPDMVAQQQAQLWQLAQRTTSLAFGRGAFTLATMQTLLTEVLSIPKLILAGRLPSQHDAMVNLDSNTGNLSDLTSWPEYHNGVASGLRLAPCQDKITRTWIIFNRPEEPSFAHAGLLMSLGLQGHLRVLSATDVYRYLSQEHEATTVGILLGMAAAHRGTMDPALSKALCFKIVQTRGSGLSYHSSRGKGRSDIDFFLANDLALQFLGHASVQRSVDVSDHWPVKVKLVCDAVCAEPPPPPPPSIDATRIEPTAQLFLHHNFWDSLPEATEEGEITQAAVNRQSKSFEEAAERVSRDVGVFSVRPPKRPNRGFRLDPRARRSINRRREAWKSLRDAESDSSSEDRAWRKFVECRKEARAETKRSEREALKRFMLKSVELARRKEWYAWWKHMKAVLGGSKKGGPAQPPLNP
ncbi:hypothetical protein GOP47_0001832 [Adiantum capillus-veneris]|uniref:Anaphase-promoting complex subunit 1 n=1 Tax=Adiantum capillus-veneris TaxID=13818 RepID=A0A9D4ZNM7_ADICA|nr:hypothetical protein GOP47_0001832 [Adiantum capillus-veneris]